MAKDFNPNFREQTLTLSNSFVSLPDLQSYPNQFYHFWAVRYKLQKEPDLTSLKLSKSGKDISLISKDDLKIKCPSKTMVFGPTGISIFFCTKI